jgi:hypothetical protein
MVLIGIRTEIVHWVSESLWSFKLVSDHGFNCLMKTGRPDYYIPLPSTVSRDVKKVFAHTRQQIAKLLQVYSQQSIPFILNTQTYQRNMKVA